MREDQHCLQACNKVMDTIFDDLVSDAEVDYTTTTTVPELPTIQESLPCEDCQLSPIPSDPKEELDTVSYDGFLIKIVSNICEVYLQKYSQLILNSLSKLT